MLDTGRTSNDFTVSNEPALEIPEWAFFGQIGGEIPEGNDL